MDDRFEVFAIKVINECDTLDAYIYLGSSADDVISKLQSPEWSPGLTLYLLNTAIFLIKEKLYVVKNVWDKHYTVKEKSIKFVAAEYDEQLHNVMMERFLEWCNEHYK